VDPHFTPEETARAFAPACPPIPFMLPGIGGPTLQFAQSGVALIDLYFCAALYDVLLWDQNGKRGQSVPGIIGLAWEVAAEAVRQRPILPVRGDGPRLGDRSSNGEAE
jgi:hypothetical protein